MNIDPASLDPAAVATFAAKAHEQSIVGFLTNIIPTTIVGAFADGDILQVLFFSVLFGIALAMVGEKGEQVVNFLNSLTAPVFKLVAILMKAAPIGAFGAMAFTIGKYGVGSIANLAMLIGTFYITSLLFVFIVLGAVARYNGFSIVALLRYIKEELLLVLGTSSSEAALPGLMNKMEKAGCKRSVVGLVIPTGYSFNLDGTNIYMTLAALFIAQATGIHLSWGDQILLLLVAMLSSKGAAGITGAKLHHACRNALRRPIRAGRWHGAHPRHRPLHVGMPGADQPRRQCGGDDRRGTLGKRAGYGATRRSTGRPDRRGYFGCRAAA